MDEDSRPEMTRRDRIGVAAIWVLTAVFWIAIGRAAYDWLVS